MVRHTFWPALILYVPVFFYYWGQALRFRSLNYFCWVNPLLPSAGWWGFSKHSLLQKIPESYRVKALCGKLDQTPEEWLTQLQQAKMTFPLVAKLNRGTQSPAVVADISSLQKYIKKYLQTNRQKQDELLLQNFVGLPEEFEAVVVRTFDGWQISSLVQKDLLFLYGDGRSSLKDLFYRHPRASAFLNEASLPTYSERILEVGQKVLLDPIARLERGAQYIDAHSVIEPSFKDSMGRVLQGLESFYLGRVTLKAATVEKLMRGEFLVISVRGLGGLPGHVFDENYKFKNALSDVIRYWRHISEIVAQNQSQFRKESVWTTMKLLWTYGL